MEQSNISLQYGIHRTPSLGNDGELSECVNLIPQDGELVNIQEPVATDFTLREADKLLFVHKTNRGVKYIVYDQIINPSPAPSSNAITYIQLYNGTNIYPNAVTVQTNYYLPRYTTDNSRDLSKDAHPDYTLKLTLADGAVVRLSLNKDGDIAAERRVSSGYVYRAYRFSTGGIQGWSQDNLVAEMEVEKSQDDTSTYYHEIKNYKPVDDKGERDDSTTENMTLKLYYFTADDQTPQLFDSVSYRTEGAEAPTCEAIGNSLIVRLSDGSVHYYLWKDSQYKVLGSDFEMPVVKPFLETRLMGLPHMLSTFGENFTKDLDTNIIGSEHITDETWATIFNDTGTDYLALNAQAKKNLYERIFAIVNPACRSIARKGLFYAPFFVRFALRMFDGTHILHTSPVLLTPTSLARPLFGVYSTSPGAANFDPVFSASQLWANIRINNSRWRDIITHLDVYVSEPLIDYTDDVQTIKGITKYKVFKSNSEIQTGWTDAEKALYSLDPWYMKGKDEIGYINEDYASDASAAFVISTTTLRAGRKFLPYKKYYRICFLLVKTADLDGLILATPNGVNRVSDLSTVNPEQVIYKKPDGHSVKWSDVGVTDVANYSRVQTAFYNANNSGKQSYKYGVGAFLSSNKDVEITMVYFKGADEGTNKPNFVFDVSRSDGINIQDAVQDASNFYLVKSIPIEDIVDGADTIIDINEFVLDALTTRETLSDEGQMRNVATKKEYITTYNNRLDAVVSRKRMPEADAMSLSSPAAKVRYDDTLIKILHAFVEIEENNQTAYKTIQPSSPATTFASTTSGLVYVSYPHAYAKRIVIATADYHLYEIALRGHKTLNLAHAFNLFSPLELKLIGSYTTLNEMYESAEWQKYLTGSDYIDYGNLIVTSSEANPFRFDEALSVTLPSEVMALSTPTRALSQGQFGQFPLYAFCADGIWALAVSDTGTYSAKQPVSRDVVTSPGSITQIDNAVVFVTNQGLKLISGSDVTLLSAPVDGLNLNETFVEQAVNAFAEKVGQDSPFVMDSSQFIDQVQNAKIVYDYPHNILHVFHDFNDGPNKHYVYSFDTQQWTTQVLGEPLKAVVPGYPLSTMQFGNNLFQYKKTTDSTMRVGYALTRPLALGDPLARKALYDLRVVGQQTTANTVRRVAVYVSNDNINWHRLPSLKALSAKYYRFLIMTYMSDTDTISGLTLQHDVRYNHKLRGH